MVYVRPPRGAEGDVLSTALSRVLQQNLFKLELDIRSAVVEATGDSIARTQPVFQAASQAIQRSLQSRTRFREAHQRLADHAREAVVQSYEERVEDQKIAPSYRQGEDRFSGGKLRRALNRQGMFVGTFEGIAFANVDILDQEAAHWYRLNYGAGAAAGSRYQPESVKISLGSRQVFETIRLDDNPSPAFYIPGGRWNEQGQFYPSPTSIQGRAQKRKLTKGIAGRHFLDAGLRSIANEITPVYNQLVATLLDDAQRTGRGAGSKIDVKLDL